MKNNPVGFILIIVGAVLLVIGYVSEYIIPDYPLKDHNWYQIICMLLIIVGIVLHIIFQRMKGRA